VHECRGHYAVVLRGTCKRTGRAVAIKKIRKFLTDPQRLQAEISVLRRVKRHPNIVELLDVYETAREVQLVLELCTGGELFERLADKGAYSEADCVRHVRDMAGAVLYLHECVHRLVCILPGSN
jgi:serine/threonine protein kinase